MILQGRENIIKPVNIPLG